VSREKHVRFQDWGRGKKRSQQIFSFLCAPRAAREEDESEQREKQIFVFVVAVIRHTSSLSTFAPPLLYWKCESLYWRLLSRGILVSTPKRLGHSQTFLCSSRCETTESCAPKRSLSLAYFGSSNPINSIHQAGSLHIPRDQRDVALSVRLFARDLIRSAHRNIYFWRWTNQN